MANPLVTGIISITIGAIMLSNVFMATVKATNTTSWSASEIALWAVLGLAGVVGLVYGTFAVFGLA
jgi:hypothetical protein